MTGRSDRIELVMYAVAAASLIGLGAWLRTRRGARPVAIHPGWRTTLTDAIEVVSSAAFGHRTPEALRSARHRARIPVPPVHALDCAARW